MDPVTLLYLPLLRSVGMCSAYKCLLRCLKLSFSDNMKCMVLGVCIVKTGGTILGMVPRTKFWLMDFHFFPSNAR
jgi:hypothetical protein